MVISISLYGCTVVNQINDSEQLFKDKRNSEIGKNIKEVLSTYHTGFKPEIIPINESQNEYLIGLPEYCYYALIVSSSTNNVLDWRYIGDPSKCKKDKYYSGPW